MNLYISMYSMDFPYKRNIKWVMFIKVCLYCLVCGVFQIFYVLSVFLLVCSYAGDVLCVHGNADEDEYAIGIPHNHHTSE